MGVRAEEPLELDRSQLADYLSQHHSIYLDVNGTMYYLTDANCHFWRAQDTAQLNEKGHYTDCSELVPGIAEFLSLQFIDGKTIDDVFDEAVFYASGDHKE
jgi:hypothetical protein